MKEYACTAVDVLARRTRLAFLNTQAAEEALPTIIKILQKELGWSNQRAKSEHEEALQFIYHEMGKKVSRSLPVLSGMPSYNLDFTSHILDSLGSEIIESCMQFVSQIALKSH